jgi:aldehyde dehydrogenase (NAD+)
VSLEYHRLFIDGQYREPLAGEAFTRYNPSTGEAVARVALARPEDAQVAVEAARRAADDGRWSGLSAARRAQVLTRVGVLILEQSDRIVEAESRDAGATISKARNADVGSGAFWFRTMADLARDLDEPEALPQTLAPGPSYNYVFHEPVGVGVAITPWNFPFQMACWKLSMALAAGNSVVLKPAVEAPISSLLLGSILRDAGVPDGVANILPGGADVGETLVRHPRVDKVSFTGSVPVGRRVMELAAGSVKNLTLELGGKSAQIVLDGADLDLAVDGVLYGCFFHAGQACTAGGRVLVPDVLHDEFVARLGQRVSRIVVGDANDPRSTMGPLVNERQLERVLRYIDIAVAEGAELVAGGSRLVDGGLDRGHFVAPTIFTEVLPEHTLAQEEVFGPVLAVMRYADLDEAVAIANGTSFGLAAGIWGPPGPSMRLARRLEAGTVWINDYHLLNPKYPFGGVKNSGVGREFGREGLLSWTETKHVHVGIDARRASKRWFDLTVPE